MSDAAARLDPGGESLLDLDVALARIESRLAPVTGVETVPLAAAAGRWLAEDLRAPLALPPFDTARMDGWAVRLADLPPDRRLPVAGRAAAGHPWPGDLPVGAAIRIFTGAAVPPGADCVVPQEECQAVDGVVTLPDGLRAGANLRPRGADIGRGHVVLPAGRRLQPQDLGLAAALGIDRLAVRRPLCVALLSTGDELHPPGGPLPFGGLYDSNRVMLAALLAGMGAETRDLGRLPDRRAAIAAALAAAAADGAHLILTSGGVSVGEEDHVKGALADAGGRLHFWRLAIKPGRPMALGGIGATTVAGLPGNPASALVTFLLVVRPLLIGLAGGRQAPPQRYDVPAGFSLTRDAGRREFLRARLVETAVGPVAEIAPTDDSGCHGPLVWASGLLDIPAAQATIAPGDTVRYLSFGGLTG